MQSIKEQSILYRLISFQLMQSITERMHSLLIHLFSTDAEYTKYLLIQLSQLMQNQHDDTQTPLIQLLQLIQFSYTTDTAVSTHTESHAFLSLSRQTQNVVLLSPSFARFGRMLIISYTSFDPFSF